MSDDRAGPRPSDAGPSSPRDDRKVLQFVGFRLADTDYAVAITRIREIILMRPITRVPQVADDIEGLINLRGMVIPIVNLRRRLGLPAQPFDEETRMIVASVGERTVGLIVDAVNEILRLGPDQIQPPPLAMSTVNRRHLAGVARADDRLLVILDLDQLLGSLGDDPATAGIEP